jgi:hypothetical protein
MKPKPQSIAEYHVGRKWPDSPLPIPDKVLINMKIGETIEIPYKVTLKSITRSKKEGTYSTARFIVDRTGFGGKAETKTMYEVVHPDCNPFYISTRAHQCSVIG